MRYGKLVLGVSLLVAAGGLVVQGTVANAVVVSECATVDDPNFNATSQNALNLPPLTLAAGDIVSLQVGHFVNTDFVDFVAIDTNGIVTTIGTSVTATIFQWAIPSDGTWSLSAFTFNYDVNAPFIGTADFDFRCGPPSPVRSQCWGLNDANLNAEAVPALNTRVSLVEGDQVSLQVDNFVDLDFVQFDAIPLNWDGTTSPNPNYSPPDDPYPIVLINVGNTTTPTTFDWTVPKDGLWEFGAFAFNNDTTTPFSGTADFDYSCTPGYPDGTGPVSAPVVTGIAQNSWYRSLTVAWNWSDDVPGSGLDTTRCPETSTGFDGEAVMVSTECYDLAGNVSTVSEGPFAIDSTPPRLIVTISPDPVPVGGTVTATPAATDNLSGVDMSSFTCPQGFDTSTAREFSVRCHIFDNAGNRGSFTVNYNVVAQNTFTFSGFLQPVDASPGLNQVKAGAGVPVKFSLSGDKGLAIFASGSPASQPMLCPHTVDDQIETTVSAGSSGLTYNDATDQYTYVWKTNKAWSGTCRVLTLKFTDNTSYTANFQFTK